LRQVTKILFVFLCALSASAFSQDKKIALSTDTSQSVPFSYTRGIYTVLMGYDEFMKNVGLDKNQATVFKQYADSLIENTGKVDLTAAVKLSRHFPDGSMVFLYVNMIGERTVNTMLEKGYARVYNTIGKYYIKQLILKTGKAKIMEEGREVKATALKYYDAGSNTEIFEYVF
jgi:hypothetical protein